MARQIEGVAQRVLECARSEFLEKGFLDASLREIAKAADTSTGSIYTRFGDKAGLFRALVEPAAGELKSLSLELQSPGSNGTPKFSLYTHPKILDFVYANFDAFYLLTQAAHGSEYAGYVDELVELEEHHTSEYLEKAGYDAVLQGPAVREFLHILATAYCDGIFEPVRHKMPREKAEAYVRLFETYHMAGFHAIFEKPNKE